MTVLTSSIKPVDPITIDVLTDDGSDAYISKTLFSISEAANIVRAGDDDLR